MTPFSPHVGKRSAHLPRNRRRVLCVSPRLAHSMATLDNSFDLVGVSAFSPVQGLLVIAAYLPASWDVRFIDESLGDVTDADLGWADVVLVTGMHIQRKSVERIGARARARGKITALGGPSVSSMPDSYPDFDLIHVGEVGDATDALIARLDLDVSRPKTQERFVTSERLPLSDFPIPAYHLIDLTKYMAGTVQFSSGCPYLCEFCDIPELYGRNPRLKSPDQVIAELDAMLERGNPGNVYLVDDNLIGNRKAAVALLERLVEWQRARGYPIVFSCEATLNLAQCPDVLSLMKEAAFQIVFCGIETPEIGALEQMRKKQNLRLPILDAVKTLNEYGLFVVSGIIFGFDSDTPQTGQNVYDFIEASNIPFLTINVLHALPRTPLYRRLEASGRLHESTDRESNIDFLLPYDQVVDTWRECVVKAYEPDALFRRFDHQMAHVFPNRKKLPNSPARLNRKNLARAARMIPKMLWQMGVKEDYRRRFWRSALPAIQKGQIEELITMCITVFHLVHFGRQAAVGHVRAGLYDPRPQRETEVSASRVYSSGPASLSA